MDHLSSVQWIQRLAHDHSKALSRSTRVSSPSEQEPDESHQSRCAIETTEGTEWLSLRRHCWSTLLEWFPSFSSDIDETQSVAKSSSIRWPPLEVPPESTMETRTDGTGPQGKSRSMLPRGKDSRWWFAYPSIVWCLMITLASTRLFSSRIFLPRRLVCSALISRSPLPYLHTEIRTKVELHLSFWAVVFCTIDFIRG